jgi:hypothetical protein
MWESCVIAACELFERGVRVVAELFAFVAFIAFVAFVAFIFESCLRAV